METLKTVEEKTLPEGYRMTELGPLPEDWRVVKGYEIFRIVPKTERVITLSDDESYTLLSVGLYGRGVTIRGLVKGKDLRTKTWYQAKEGDFLLLKIWARKGSYGFVNFNKRRMIVSGDYPILRVDEQQASIKFLEFLLARKQIWQQLDSGAKGATNRQRIGVQDFLEILTIPLPPLPEQKAIAQVLKSVQEAKEKTEEVIKALKEFKKSLMRHLFTYGPVPVNETDRVEMRETEIGPLPAHWKVVRLGKIVNLTIGRTPPRKQESYWNKGKFPWVTVSDLNNGVVYSTNEKVSEIAKEKIFRYPPVPAGTLLLSFKLTIGKVGILGVPAYHNEAIVSVFPKEEEAHKEFLFFLFQSMDFKNFQDAYAKGNTLNKTKLLNLPIPLPPLHEQRQIARILQAVDRRIEAEENRKQALEDLFRSLLHNLMTAKIRLPKEFINRFAENE